MRDFDDGAVRVSGWARIQGPFARKEGQRVGDFLKSLSLLLPDTYMERGEVVRTLQDGSKRFLAFNVTKALGGDPRHNLLLENRDDIELYRIGDLRLPLSVTVLGPVTRPGRFEFIQGMRPRIYCSGRECLLPAQTGMWRNWPITVRGEVRM